MPGSWQPGTCAGHHSKRGSVQTGAPSRPFAPAWASWCPNGGLLLRNNELDEDYRRETNARLAGSTPLSVVFARLQAVADPRFSINLRTVEDLFCYAVVDIDTVPGSWAVELAGYAADVGWQVSDQGRKVYLLPDELSKGQAVRRIADELNLDGFIAAGDTNADVSMLRVAADAIIPAHHVVSSAQTGNAPATSAIGVGAGEEIVQWAARKLLTPNVSSTN